MSSWVQQKRKVVDLDGLMKFERVDYWAHGLKPGPGRKTALYHLDRFLRSRASHGFSKDPDQIIDECLKGLGLKTV